MDKYIGFEIACKKIVVPPEFHPPCKTWTYVCLLPAANSSM